jgi:glycosyltransferase involved in cell wall biosynthesis
MKKEIKYKPRIAVDARPLSYGLTGNSRYLFESLKYLIREDSRFEYYLYSNKKIHPMFLPFLEEKKVKIKIFSITGILWLNFLIPIYIIKDRIDIFWGTLQLLPFFKLNIPELVNYHDLNFIAAPLTMSKGNLIQHKLFSPRSIQNADEIFCLSKNTQREIAEFSPLSAKKLKLVYPGVIKKEPLSEEKLNSFKDQIPSPYIFSLGTLEPRKNISTIVDAYLQIKTENPDFKYNLVLAGRKGWGEEELTSRLLSKELESKGIYFFENPEDDFLQFLLQNSILFLFPSLHEGFGLPILEALIEQKVCIVSDIPIFKEIIEEGIDLSVSPKEASSWKNAILKLTQKQTNLKRKKIWDENKWSWIVTASNLENSFLLHWHKHWNKEK